MAAVLALAVSMQELRVGSLTELDVDVAERLVYGAWSFEEDGSGGRAGQDMSEEYEPGLLVRLTLPCHWGSQERRRGIGT